MHPLAWVFVALGVGWTVWEYMRTQQRAAVQNHREAPVPEKKNREEPSPKPRFVPKVGAAPRTMTKWEEDIPEPEEGFVWMKHEVDETTGEVRF